MIAAKTDRQKEIIDASLKLIAKKGIQGLTIKNLANQIGFSEAAVYRHYENKIQILIAILDNFSRSAEHLFSNQTTNETNAMAKIEQLFMNHFKTFAKSPSIVSVIFSEEIFRNEAVLIDKMAEIMKRNFAYLKKLIEAGQREGEIRTDLDALHLSTIIMGTLRLFVKQWQMSNYTFDIVKKGGELTNSLKILLK